MLPHRKDQELIGNAPVLFFLVIREVSEDEALWNKLTALSL